MARRQAPLLLLCYPAPEIRSSPAACCCWDLQCKTCTTPPTCNAPLQFLGACTKKEPYILVTELMSGGSLADAFRRPQVFPMRRAVEIALDAARGLAYLHHRYSLPAAPAAPAAGWVHGLHRSGPPKAALCWNWRSLLLHTCLVHACMHAWDCASGSWGHVASLLHHICTTLHCWPIAAR